MKAAVTILVFCVAALLALGMVMLYSATVASSGAGGGARSLAMQLIWCVLGLAACVAATLVDYRLLKKYWWLILSVAFVMLILVLVLGSVRNHARRWFCIGSLSFQPSEFAKVALVIALAWYCERYQRQMGTWKKGILIPCIVIGVFAGLLFKEPDVGNAMVLATVSGTMLLVAGIRLKYFLPPVLIVVVALGVFLYHNPMRSERIYSWLHLEETRRGIGRQAYEARIALGSGGLLGKGLGDGRQKLGFVPEQHTDFIFSIIGEELGLLATLLVVAAFVGIVVCGTIIAQNASDNFGMLLAAGITFLIGLQAFINIGVVTSALPNKGLPLPFISYGGSNLLMMLVSVGLLLSVARRARSPELSQPSDPGELSTPRSRGNPFAAPVSSARQTGTRRDSIALRCSNFPEFGFQGLNLAFRIST